MSELLESKRRTPPALFAQVAALARTPEVIGISQYDRLSSEEKHGHGCGTGGGGACGALPLPAMWREARGHICGGHSV